MLKLVPNVYKWQRWLRGYEPTEEDFNAMGQEEYDLYFEEQVRYDQLALYQYSL